jgi:K(+)-stimulated pyrophosphate-energized sodium pump
MLIYSAGVGVLGLLFVAYLSVKVLSKETGNAVMQEISGFIYEGAMAFLVREYRAIAFFVAIVAVLI